MADSLPTVAVMVPMHAYPERTLSSIWASWYRLKYPRDKLTFYFAIPANSPKKSFVMQNFRLRHQVISLNIDYTKFTNNRFFEIGKIRDVLLEYGKKHDYGWFLDSDVAPHANSINYFLEDNCDIVGGIVLVPDNRENIRLGFGYFHPFYDFSNTLPNEQLFQVDACNTACLFVSKEVMNDPKVSFKLWKYQDNGQFKDNPYILSEDHGFCFNALQRNYGIYVDRRVTCKHLRNFGGKIVNLQL